jgi:hypothetical protein
MSTSRRDFLKKGSLVALAAGIPLSVAGKVMGKEPVASSNGLGSLGLSKAAFKAQLNTDFLIHDGTTKRKVRLFAVEDLLQSDKFGGKEGFSLLFRGDPTSRLVQNTYFIEHARLGSFSFLLVPILARDKSAPQYEAIINHLHP